MGSLIGPPAPLIGWPPDSNCTDTLTASLAPFGQNSDSFAIAIFLFLDAATFHIHFHSALHVHSYPSRVLVLQRAPRLAETDRTLAKLARKLALDPTGRIVVAAAIEPKAGLSKWIHNAGRVPAPPPPN